jgi:hypothetical protein
MSDRSGRFVWVRHMGRLTPERWPDDGYLPPIFRAVAPVASHAITAEQMTWPLADLEERFPPPEEKK